MAAHCHDGRTPASEPRFGALRSRGSVAFVVQELALWTLVYPLYLLSREILTSSPGEAQRHARDLISLEHVLGLRFEHAVQSAVTSSPLLEAGFDAYYEAAFYPLIVVALVWLGLFRRELYRGARSAMIVSLLLAMVFFILFPTAPPRLVSGLGIRDTIGMQGHDVGSFHGIRYNPYAAMPSLHVDWSVIVASSLYRSTRRQLLRALALLHPVLMAIATIATGNHYVLDCVVGASIGLVALRLVGALGADGPPREPQPAAPVHQPA
jgi:hypothetical protein